MVNYQNGKIYKIECHNTGKIYIGSTCSKYLCQRLGKHVEVFTKQDKRYTSREVLEGGNYSIKLVELFPSNSKDELLKREQYYIDNTQNCVNKYKTLVTNEQRKTNSKQYYIDNKIVYQSNNKKWYEGNKQQINEKRQEKHICECGGKYTTSHKSEHLKSKKHLSYKN
jgi:hypothetical protein